MSATTGHVIPVFEALIDEMLNEIATSTERLAVLESEGRSHSVEAARAREALDEAQRGLRAIRAGLRVALEELT